jgi:hypothetical protein
VDEVRGQEKEKCAALITCDRPLDGADWFTHRDQTGGGEASNGLAGMVGGSVPLGKVVQISEREESEREATNGLAGMVGGGVPLGKVVQISEREESEREGEETASWHRRKMEGGRLR